ncbi:hypothetical protein FBEOM_3505 [Fusarium beomiforme]|uniref:Uncharacterized protein n=1 Tax=Fusarium beomiforme TaxID=44412 RepID=A0A9P5APZ0_9HYPO|nr:hypothetical protein FBEOM_3505 [Fusarium beomiforme]
MLRLQPTTIKIATRDLSDAERRSRYRKHLANRQKATSRRNDLIQHDRDTVLENALHTRIVTPTTDSSNGQDTPGSPEQNETGGEEELEAPVPLLDYGTMSSDEATLYVNVDRRTNHLRRQSEQHRLPFRSRQSLDSTQDADTMPISIRTRPRDTISDSSVIEGESTTTEQLPAAAVDTSLYGSEREASDDDSQTSGELVNFPQDEEEISISPTDEELETATPRIYLPVYSDRLPVENQPQIPQQLPEARHQSRFDGVYTAPVRGRQSRVEIDDAPGTVRRRRAGRNASPLGLRTPGFQGLYGGSENADDV